MPSTLLFNRVKVNTSTTGTGTVTLGAAFSNAFCTFAEAGVANGNVVTYTIEDGSDFEVGRGTYTSSGTTLSRDTVLLSKISGTSGTSKISLSGSAVVFLTAAKEDFDVNNFTEDTSPDGTADFHWMHDASAAIRKKVKPTNLVRAGGLQLLNSGTVSSAATLDIVLTSYTSYRALKLLLSSFVPATDDVELWLRFSSNAGSSFDASGYSHQLFHDNDADTDAVDPYRSTSANQIPIAGFPFANLSVSNVAAEGGVDAEITVHQQAASRWTRARISSGYTTADSKTATIRGTGTREAQQDTDALRVVFESGNIASGNWALYGYA